MKSEIITPEGRVTTARPKGKAWSLEEMQEIVGGWIEIVPTLDGRLMILNEEGKLDGLPANSKATALFGDHDVIVGTVLVTDPKLVK